jgi:CHAD domain-containing protein
LDLFGDLFPKQDARWMKKRLRELRQAAGDARDLDVLGERLREVAATEEHDALGEVIHRIERQRRQAQRTLVSAYKSAKQKGLWKRSRKLANAVHWSSDEAEPQFVDAASARLVPLVQEFLKAAQADLSDIETLHEMRICGKQVRYAMEILAGAFEKSFRTELYANFEEVQEKLGDVNDHATAITTFTAWIEQVDSEGSRAKLAELVATEEKLLDERCDDFRKWWTSERVAALEQQFEDALFGSTDAERGESAPRRLAIECPQPIDAAVPVAD